MTQKVRLHAFLRIIDHSVGNTGEIYTYRLGIGVGAAAAITQVLGIVVMVGGDCVASDPLPRFTH